MGEEIARKPGKLIGEEEATIDDKGRVLVSKKKRDRLGEGFVLTQGPFGCLEAFPADIWDELTDDILKYDRLNEGRREVARLYIAPAVDELKFDAQGRCVIPQKLREAARIESKLVLIGCGDFVEIWAKEEYQRYLDDPKHYNGSRRLAFNEAYGRMRGVGEVSV